MTPSPTKDTQPNTPQDGPSAADLQDLVASADTGARSPLGLPGKVLFAVALAWSLFQLWFASPLPFMLGFGVLNDTEARAVHLAFGIFLAFTAYPALRSSPRRRVPITDWILALVAAFCAAYLFLFYSELAMRPARPTTMDIVVGCVGVVLLLEATRRTLGPPLMIIAILALIYVFVGPYMPDVVSHRGASLALAANHFWTTTLGVFGIALGVSTSFVFLFVLFGSMLDKAGAGNYFIKVAFSLLGHLRGGPAKAAVVSSALTGVISGSSIANVVTTGTFTIPLMKRVGYPAEKAGAVEVSSSVNGQIMPPVMGAAAFLMIEYVGIPYSQVVKHAFLPALISYIGLLYIVHLEALKADMKALPKPGVQRSLPYALIRTGLILCSILILAGAVYWVITGIQAIAGGAANWLIGLLIGVTYLLLLRHSAKYPELEADDPNAPVVKLPEAWPTIQVGLHFLLPVVVLVWALLVEQLSPGLSAFWASLFMIFILVTQRPLKAFFRRSGDLGAAARQGFNELLDGLTTGARNMIGIAIATATAGIIVGMVTLTGLGAVMADVVEAVSGGNLILVLLLTALISLILGMGLPTTANYIVVATLMAPVIVELSVQSGVIVPLIAAHLFVFYFGIMADVTPPVGLASFAAAAVSRADPIRTGLVAFFYSLRTAVLPFLFIFNTDLLLIDVTLWHGTLIFFTSTVAMLTFAAATQGYFFVRSRLWESAVLLLVTLMLLRPDAFMNQIFPPLEQYDASEIEEVLPELEQGTELRMRILGQSATGAPREFTTLFTVGAPGTAEERLDQLGLMLYHEGDRILIDSVGFGSPAQSAGLEFDDEILFMEVRADVPPKELLFIPAFLLLGFIILLQRVRLRRQQAVPAKA
ncbi:TRAP transporter permease [Telmatospirillum sp. J64-1]|uniref:TRAP transporter permease n=1 Tax=Telmatospirillum sp. J64-1 TaxID=2502183 RepID=UPI00115F5E7B|nr:TRAP transporter permease [Telmatospirillum sp. J64-1]